MPNMPSIEITIESVIAIVTCIRTNQNPNSVRSAASHYLGLSKAQSAIVLAQFLVAIGLHLLLALTDLSAALTWSC